MWTGCLFFALYNSITDRVAYRDFLRQDHSQPSQERDKQVHRLDSIAMILFEQTAFLWDLGATSVTLAAEP